MTIGIIAAMAVEMEHLQGKMDIHDIRSISGFIFYVGNIDNVGIVLTTCNIGKVNAACCTQLMIDTFKIDFIINTGIAGGIHSKLKLLDVVIASEVTYYDFELLQGIQTIHPVQTTFTCSKLLIDLAKNAYERSKTDSHSVYIGRIATGDRFISCREEKKKIEEGFSPLCVEMEGAAIGHVATTNQIPFVVIRAISDLADDVAEITYEELEQKAALNSSHLVLKMVGSILQAK